MNWTTDKPITPGWYWYRKDEQGSQERLRVYVTEDQLVAGWPGGQSEPVINMPGEWSAPLKAAMSWTNERPTLPGFYWFKGTVTFTSATHEVILAMVVELTGAVPYVKVWFPKKDVPIPISACEGQWFGPLEVPR